MQPAAHAVKPFVKTRRHRGRTAEVDKRQSTAEMLLRVVVDLVIEGQLIDVPTAVGERIFQIEIKLVCDSVHIK